MDLEAGVPANTSTLPPAVRRESSRVNGNLSSVNASADESHTNDVHQSIEGQTSVEFVPPIEGTPAALALAGKYGHLMLSFQHDKNIQMLAFDTKLINTLLPPTCSQCCDQNV